MSREPERGAIERWVRSGWGEPGPGVRAAATLYGAVVDARNALWNAGVFRPFRVDAPVISIGGLSTGGSGKTPITAALAEHLAEHGARVAVVTAGQGDELSLHAELNPGVPVSGGRWRIPLAVRAVEAGAEVLLLDSGFQHRRLHRDLEVITCNADQAVNRERLPAGPYRERFEALGRADAVVVMRRVASPDQSEALQAEIAAVAPRALIAAVRLAADGLRPANRAASAVATPDPAVAVAGVMWPESFFRWLTDQGVEPLHRFALRDHARYDQRTVEDIAAAAGERGLVCTRKDGVRLVELVPDRVPVWWLEESVVWEGGAERLLAGVRRVAGLGA